MLFILWPKSAKSPALTRASSVALGKSPGFSGLPILHLQHEDAYVHAQLCPTLCDPMGYSPPGSFVHGISQAGILEWVAISSSRGSSRHRDGNCISCISFIDRWILYLPSHLGCRERSHDLASINSCHSLHFSEKPNNNSYKNPVLYLKLLYSNLASN